MPSNLSPEEFYRREAERLRTMAASPIFSDVRDGLVRMAHQYDVLATQRSALERHSFGSPFEQREFDHRRGNASDRARTV